jgi:hypothetical protein
MTEPPAEGRVRPTGAGSLVGAGLLGLVLGWAVRAIGERTDSTAPLVTWGPAAALGLVAVILGWTAWVTGRQIRLRRFLAPHQAVNRLVLAKASAVVGAVVGGGYAGYALSWFGADAELGGQRAWRSGAAAMAAIAVIACSLWLERACRVRNDDHTT